MGETKKLTRREEKFVTLVATGTTKRHAFEQAYPEQYAKMPTVHAASIAASMILAKPHIKAALEVERARVAEEDAKYYEELRWTRQDSIRALKSVVDDPDKKTDIVIAVKELNVMHGYNAPIKLDHTSSDGSMTPQPALDVTKLSAETLREIIGAADASGSDEE